MAERTPGAREAAAQVLAAVLCGKSLSEALPSAAARVAGTDRPLLQELCYGTLRWYFRLNAVLQRLLKQPLKPKDKDVDGLLLVGLYQLAYLEIPPHAAVSETVEAVDRLGKRWAKGLVNGVLRRFQRERVILWAAVEEDVVARYAHPRWLLERLQRGWPDDWTRIAQANNERPPFTLRVNRLQHERSAYARQLEQAGFTAVPTRFSDVGLAVAPATAVEHLPGFAAGSVSVQDEAAQLAAPLLELQPGQRVLDACAAPGGKSAHLLEREPSVELLALDADAQRLTRVSENLQRLALKARITAGDAAEPSPWWDGDRFQRILLDAPCSATGVIRRHPDIKVLRRASDMAPLVEQQQRILAALWPLLEPGGILVYATCSVLPEENAEQLARFLQARSDARELPIGAEWGRRVAVGRQILPGEDGMDGFYYARLVKN